MSVAPNREWTEEAYFAFDRSCDQKHGYLQGHIYAMAGASPNHHLVAGNTFASLHFQLRQSPCRVYNSDQRLKVKRTGLITYPNISVFCDTPKFLDENSDTLTNPALIVEVLSPTTESYDRGKKFQHYRMLEWLQEYVLIAQDSHRVERYLRQASGDWLLTDVVELDSTLELSSIQCTLSLADVYEKVMFEELD